MVTNFTNLTTSWILRLLRLSFHFVDYEPNLSRFFSSVLMPNTSLARFLLFFPRYQCHFSVWTQLVAKALDFMTVGSNYTFGRSQVCTCYRLVMIFKTEKRQYIEKLDWIALFYLNVTCTYEYHTRRSLFVPKIYKYFINSMSGYKEDIYTRRDIITKRFAQRLNDKKR